jgi:hypothetical protein
MKRKLKAGMVGGGREAFIGGVHRMALRLDGKIDLVAGAFSSSAQKSRLSGEDLLLDSKRVYTDYRTMAEEEARLPIGERIDFVSIVTPNRTHVPVATGQPIPTDCDFPTVDDGVDGMAFIATAVQSAKAGGVWTKMTWNRKS